MIQLNHIFKEYTLGKEALVILKDINLEIGAGEYVAIMGPSGSGKSTLMNILGCLDKATSGSYSIDGVEVSTLSENKTAGLRNERIGFVFQQFHLLPKLKAIENVALPLLYQGVKKAERIERARQALIELGLENRLDFYPNQLSGGQCQRVAIARAMVTKPKLLLADEPTGALDSASGEQTMELFENIHKNSDTTIVLITHDPHVASYAKTLYLMRDGKLSEADKKDLERPAIQELPVTQIAAPESETEGDHHEEA